MTAQKFGRNYLLTIQPPDNGPAIVVQPPTTINIDCFRALMPGQNTLELDIYNLSAANQKRIYWDKNVPGNYFTPAGPQNLNFVNVTLKAGYGKQLNTIFAGHMAWADSARQGTNIITHISANDGLPDVLGGQINTVLSDLPVTANQILAFLAAQYPDLTIGAIGNFPQVFNRPVVLQGNIWRLIEFYASPGTPFIDNGKIYILNNEDVAGGTFVLNDATGILNTPRRELSHLMVTTLMETGVQNTGQMVQVQSSIMKQYNGIYKVYAVQHRGTISGAVCGKMESIFTLVAPAQYGSPNQSGTGFNIVPLAQAVAA